MIYEIISFLDFMTSEKVFIKKKHLHINIYLHLQFSMPNISNHKILSFILIKKQKKILNPNNQTPDWWVNKLCQSMGTAIWAPLHTSATQSKLNQICCTDQLHRFIWPLASSRLVFITSWTCHAISLTWTLYMFKHYLGINV